jgi:hypothetical protein
MSGKALVSGDSLFLERRILPIAAAFAFRYHDGDSKSSIARSGKKQILRASADEEARRVTTGLGK